ncbi:hypothetical protein CDD82_2911 [Ophiocordyceps australis]|uniref:General transcription and DNA repair factor IIH n=1 Tax=Ophiocordyceps australis TaxID=1399860 RepID=A0A2C5YKT4_9HYPO|nr:hypothetical protein CDD82_2911 [Ophiocordyceps australis]
MADSDGEFVAEGVSDDDVHDVNFSDDDEDRRRGPGKSSQQPPRKRRRRGERASAQQAWEKSKRSWETNLPDEDDDGVLKLTALEAERRRRLLRDTTPVQRGIMRHMVLVIDMSFAMADKDMLPTRYRVTLGYAAAFVEDYFEQNPISQLAIVGTRDGIAVRISELGGNPAEHLERLRTLEDQEPQGNPSLQNALEMCRSALLHAPSHGTREVLVIYGALLSRDPGDIYETISSLVADRIRVSMVGMSAEVFICAQLCARTNDGHDGHYRVAMDEVHLRELFLAATTPPITRSAHVGPPSLHMVGFPSLTIEPAGALAFCACHNRPCREGYACTRCCARVCRLPAECPICGLTLILSTNLARSYHHLFPLRNWVEVSWADAARSTVCFACQCPFPDASSRLSRSHAPADAHAQDASKHPQRPDALAQSMPKGVSESGRYACQICACHFCIDCDVYAHQVLHNCPGCQSNQAGSTAIANGAMDLDS